MLRIDVNKYIYVLVSSLAHCTMRENNSNYRKNVQVWNELMSKLVLFVYKTLLSVFHSVFEYFGHCNCHYNLVSFFGYGSELY
jgi:hypothetical protein